MMQMLPLPACEHGDPSAIPMAHLVVDRLDNSKIATTETPSLR